MAENPDSSVDRIEAAANITLSVSTGFDDTTGQSAGFMEIPISRLDTTKEVEISEIRENSLKASGYSITSISYSGTMMFKGSRLTKVLPESAKDDQSDEEIADFLYDDNGVPVPVSINIYHDLAEESENYEDVLVTSESYEVRSEETTETAFDWVAMDRASDQPN